MRLSDLFFDKIAETKLFEMARSRQDAKDKITDLSPMIIKHLIKLFVFNSPENKTHWITEIDGWFGQIDDIYLKPSKKKPDWQTVYNWIIFDSSPHYCPEYVDGVVRKMLKTDYKSVKVYDYSSELVLNQILKIIEQVCKDISTPHKFTSINHYLN